MSTPADDIDRDAWLGAALRHAPDAQARPPAALDETILRAARAAVRAEATPSRGAVASLFAWLARPPVAAGFAGVMVATVLGLMWWDRPIDEALAPRASAPGASPPAIDAPSAAPAAAPSPQREDAAPAAKAESRTAIRTSPSPAPARARSSAPPPVAAPARDAASNRASPEAFGRVAPRVADAPAVALSRSDRRDERAATDAAPGASPLAALLASIDAQPARWRWQLDDRAAQPMTPALQQWLRRFDAATGGGWRTFDAAPASPPGNARTLRLSRDAEPALLIQLGDDSAWFAPAGQARLSAEGAATLRRALDDATR